MRAAQAVIFSPQVCGVSTRPGEIHVFGTDANGTAWTTAVSGGRWNPPTSVYPLADLINVSTLTAYAQPGHYDVFFARGPVPPAVAEGYDLHFDGQNTTVTPLGPVTSRLSQAVQADAVSGQLLKRVVARNENRQLVTRWTTSNTSAWQPPRWWGLDSAQFDTEPRIGAIKPGRYDVLAIANCSVQWLYVSTSDAEGRGDVALDMVPGGLCAFTPTTLIPAGVGLSAVGCADDTLYCTSVMKYR